MANRGGEEERGSWRKQWKQKEGVKEKERQRRGWREGEQGEWKSELNTVGDFATCSRSLSRYLTIALRTDQLVFRSVLFCSVLFVSFGCNINDSQLIIKTFRDGEVAGYVTWVCCTTGLLNNKCIRQIVWVVPVVGPPGIDIDIGIGIGYCVVLVSALRLQIVG